MISIIANFYKSEKYIPRLIESVLSQTYSDWELICVNDCSPLNDLRVIEKYALKDNRIKIVNNEKNLGISKAKFEGIKRACGKYLMFIDGDDWLEPDALKHCIYPAEKYDVDMVILSSQKVLHYGISLKKKKSINKDANRVITNPELFERYYLNFFGVNLFSVTYWGKLIRREAFNRANLVPSDCDYSEDLIFNMMLFPHLRSIYMLDYVGYNWRWGGITSGRLKFSVEREIKLLTFVMSFYDFRMKLINQYDYGKAKRWLTIELVNYLICGITSIAKTKNPNADLIAFIGLYINKIKENQEFLTDCCSQKYQVVLNGDANEVYSYCYGVNQKQKVRNVLKSIIHKIVD